MTTPLRCLVIVAVLPYALAFIGGLLRLRQLGNLDNKHPRLQAMHLEGIAARAYAAQANAWEALSLFTAAVVVAHVTGADAGRSAVLAEGFVATRVLHPALYLANLDVLRSLVFVVGLGCIAGLFAISL